MYQILEQALGEEASPEAILHACAMDTVAFGEQWLALYRGSDLEAVPTKLPHEFRPGFLVDYVGREDTPYTREFDFVQRSLLYAHSVAVVDELEGWVALDPNERDLHWQLGFRDANNLAWAAIRVAYYAEFERAGLLHYVDGPHYASKPSFERLTSSADLTELYPLVKERNGYVVPLPENDIQRDLYDSNLNMWFRQLDAVIGHGAVRSGVVDVHLPEWFAGPQLLDWTLRHSAAAGSKEHLADESYLQQLLHLPAPLDAHRDPEQLVLFRQHDLFEQWRNDLETGLDYLSGGREQSVVEAARAVRAASKYLASREELARTRVRSSPSLRKAFTTAFTTGITTTVGASAVNLVTAPANPGTAFVSGTAVGTSTLAAQLAAALYDRFRSAQVSTETVTRHYQLFGDGSLRGWRGAMPFDPPPTSWMESIPSGRPLALDLFPHGPVSG